MGQLKKVVPRKTRDVIAEAVEDRLPEGSLRRKHFADAISVGGALLVAGGAVVDSKGFKRTGMTLRGVGETADDFDGDTARRLGTDGRSGALVDSVLDKFKVLIEVGVLWSHAKNMTATESTSRKTRLSAIAGKHVVNAAINIYATTQGAEVESSQAGKVNMWMDGLAIGFWGISDASESPVVRSTANTLGNVAFAAGIATGIAAMYGYAEQALHPVHVPPAGYLRLVDSSNLDYQPGI